MCVSFVAFAESAVDDPAADENSESEALRALEVEAMQPSSLVSGPFRVEILAPHQGTFVGVLRELGRVPELHHAAVSVPAGSRLLEIESVRERFDATQMFGLTLHDDPSVRSYLDFFDGRGKPTLARWMARMGRFEPLIRQTLREEGLPEDLIYVAMIESGFSPRAVSSASAVGVWQFIATTGSEMGLAITPYIDERRDPVKATRAACKYFKLLYDRFGSWPLAMAAYNGGPGLMRKNVRRHNSNDYWFIQRQGGMYDETRRYVPKVVAAGLVAKNADVFGLGAVEKVDPFDFDSVEVPRSTMLRVFAKAADTDVATLRALNPALRRAQTPPGDGLYSLRIPRGSTQVFVENYDALKDGENEHEIYTLKFGQSLRDLSIELNVAPRVLRAANGLESGARVAYGTELVVPVEALGKWRKSKSSSKKTIVVPKESPHAEGTRVFYRVQHGDTLDVVARGLGVKPGDLLLWNFLDPRARLQPGMILQAYVPSDLDRSNVFAMAEADVNAVVEGSPEHKRMTRKKKKPRRFYHRVKSGESLWLIARKYRVTVDKLKRWNRKIRRNNTLQPGQRILVYPGRR